MVLIKVAGTRSSSLSRELAGVSSTSVMLTIKVGTTLPAAETLGGESERT